MERHLIEKTFHEVLFIPLFESKSDDDKVLSLLTKTFMCDNEDIFSHFVLTLELFSLIKIHTVTIHIL